MLFVDVSLQRSFEGVLLVLHSRLSRFPIYDAMAKWESSGDGRIKPGMLNRRGNGRKQFFHYLLNIIITLWKLLTNVKKL